MCNGIEMVGDTYSLNTTLCWVDYIICSYLRPMTIHTGLSLVSAKTDNYCVRTLLKFNLKIEVNYDGNES